MTLPVPFRLSVLEPNIVSDAHQLPKRLNVDSGLSQKHLQLASGLFFWLIRSLKQSVHNVCHGFLREEEIIAPFEDDAPLREQAVECAWHLLIIVGMSPIVFFAAEWMRYGA